MPIISRNPVVQDDKTYDRLAVRVSISPVMKPADVGPSFAIEFSHYRKSEDGMIEVPQNNVPVGFAYSSALPKADDDVERCVREIMALIAELADKKGI